MNRYWQLLALFSLALAGAAAWQLLSGDPGYLLITFRGWSVESTLIVAVLLIGLGLSLIWLLWRALRAPFRLWRRRRQALAQERLADGLLAVCEGQWSRAEKLLNRAAGERSQRQAALLMAAQVALARGASDRAEHLLQRAREAGAETGALVLDARRLLESGQAEAACALLETAASEQSLPPAALELQAKGKLACGRAADALGMMSALRASKLREGASLEALENEIAVAALAEAADGDDLNGLWSSLPRELKTRAGVVHAFAGRAAQLDLAERAASAIETFLGKHWDEQVAALYGQLLHPQPRKAIKRAEQWLQDQPDSVGALLALGELCRREQLWGKAEGFLQRALQSNAPVAWEALGRLYSDRGDHGRARQALHNALFAARGEPTSAVRAVVNAERELAAIEQRTSMGLPRLPEH